MTGIPPKKPRLHILEVPDVLQYRIISKLPFKSKINVGLAFKHWDLLLRAGTSTERHWVVELNLDTFVSSEKSEANLWDLTTFITRWLAKRAAAIESVHVSATVRPDLPEFGLMGKFLESLLSLAAGCLSNFDERLHLTIHERQPVWSGPISHAHFAAICQLSHLEELSLNAAWEQSEEGLQEVTSDFSKLVKLKVLKIHDHGTWENMPDSICYLQKLEHMEIMGTKVGQLPNLNLDNLSMVKLMDCSLGCAPETLTAISALTSLDLSLNDFQHPMGGQWWPTSLSRLTHLGELIIDSCRIESLPSHLSALVQLKKLDVSGNRLRSLPDELSRLQNLKDLLLTRNFLATVPVSILSTLTTLHTINLSLQFHEDGEAMFSILSPLLPLLHPGLVKLDLHQFERLEPLSLFHVGRAVYELATRGRPVQTLLY